MVKVLNSTGKHNELQKVIIEEFAPRFAPNSDCLYVGDTIEKDLVKNVEKLKELGFEITLHDKMPDVVLYREDKDWIYFVESVTSVGSMDPKRILEIEEMTKERENLLSEGIDPQEKAIAFKVLNQMTQNANQIYEEEKKKNDK